MSYKMHEWQRQFDTYTLNQLDLSIDIDNASLQESIEPNVQYIVFPSLVDSIEYKCFDSTEPYN